MREKRKKKWGRKRMREYELREEVTGGERRRKSKGMFLTEDDGGQ